MEILLIENFLRESFILVPRRLMIEKSGILAKLLVLSFSDVSKSSSNREFLTSQLCLCT